MKLLGRSVNGRRLVEEVRARLSARGVQEDTPDAPLADEVPVEPYAFLVQGLEENADPAQAPPGARPLGKVRDLVRFAARGLLEELFGRQHSFNVHVRDLAAQLSAEVLALRARVEELERPSRRGAAARQSKHRPPRGPKAGRRPRRD
jgi:hypothetical protein